MPPWLAQISSCQKKESKFNSTRFIQLATISLDNTPRVRTVVFRGWSESYKMKILTDKRSSKFKELESNDNVEVCWYFPKSRCQFRLRGRAKVDFGSDHLHHWNQLDDKSQSMWGWSSPGEKFNSEEIEDIMNNDSASFNNFILLKVDIYHVDELVLKKPLHFRRQWVKRNIWIEERINP